MPYRWTILRTDSAPGRALRGMIWRLEDEAGSDTLSAITYDSTSETEPSAAMSDIERGHERGAYTPHTDAPPLAFDARLPRRRRPLPVTLILSVLILLGLILALGFIYRSGTRKEGDAPRPVGEPVGAVREAAPAEAQPTDAAASLDIYTDEAQGVPNAPIFTAPPEAPVARPAPTPSAPAPVAAAVPAPRVAVTPAPTPVRAPAATPAPVRSSQTATASTAPRPSTPAPAAPAMRPTPPPAAAPAATAAPSGGASAQIGAYNTRDQAQAALARAAGGRGTRIEPVERDGKTLYRALITGFPDRAAAQSFCGSVAGGCIVR